VFNCVYSSYDYFDDADLDEHANVSWTLKMRTDPANCGGADVVASRTGIMSKSQQDVEAAFAIAQLSEQEPRARMDSYLPTASYKADSPLMNGCGSPNTRNAARFSHMRTAVMPHVSSRVEKAAVKRRFDSPNDERAAVNSYKRGRLEDMVDPVQQAIESERDTFMTSRRQNFARTDTVDDELVGRFVRTCGPSDRDDVQHQLYVKVSDSVVSPTLVSSVSANTRNERGDHDRPPVLSPAVTEQSYRAHPVPRRRRHHDPSDTVYCWDTTRTPASKRHVYRQQIPAVMMSYQEMLTRPGNLHSPLREGDGNRSASLVNAYYSLGKSAAAAAASQLFVKRPSVAVSNCPLQLTSGLTSGQSHVTSGQSRLQGRVDSCTLRKVRRGEFGALRTLRQYCSQLRRHSAPVSSSDVVKQSDDNEVAVDLSVRKQTLSADDDSVGSSWYRSSRSCDSSPSVKVEEVPERRHTVGQLTQRSTMVDHQLQRLSSISLPSSPYCTYHADDRHTRQLCDKGDDTDDRTHNNVSEAVDVIADSRLPLKKRRLHYNHHSHHHHQQQQQEQQQCVISASDCDNNCTSADNTRHSHGQCVYCVLLWLALNIVVK